MPLGEFQLIERFFKRSAGALPKHIDLSVGDDGAILSLNDDEQMVVSVDTLVEGVHFPHSSPPELVASRALRVNLSDLAAMAATPVAYTLALTLPKSDERWLGAFSGSLNRLAEQYGIELVGGDTTRGPLSISITAFGKVKVDCALRRDGAEAEDDIWVTGTLGDAAAVIESKNFLGESYLHNRFWHPEPQTRFSVAARELLHSGLDISDGLVADLAHIATASGLSAAIDIEKLPISESALKANSREKCEQLALMGGDDYQLCFTAPQSNSDRIEVLGREMDVPISLIGTMRVGESGCVTPFRKGEAVSLPHSGYAHF